MFYTTLRKRFWKIYVPKIFWFTLNTIYIDVSSMFILQIKINGSKMSNEFWASMSVELCVNVVLNFTFLKLFGNRETFKYVTHQLSLNSNWIRHDWQPRHLHQNRYLHHIWRLCFVSPYELFLWTIIDFHNFLSIVSCNYLSIHFWLPWKWNKFKVWISNTCKGKPRTLPTLLLFNALTLLVFFKYLHDQKINPEEKIL